MSRSRSPLESAAGKLISAIQKEWTSELGEASATLSEEIMHQCHDLLLAAKTGSIQDLIGERTIADFLGRQWVSQYPRVWPHIQVLEALALDAPD